MGDGNQLPLPDDMYHAFREMVSDFDAVGNLQLRDAPHRLS